MDGPGPSPHRLRPGQLPLTAGSTLGSGRGERSGPAPRAGPRAGAPAPPFRFPGLPEQAVSLSFPICSGPRGQRAAVQPLVLPEPPVASGFAAIDGGTAVPPQRGTGGRVPRPAVHGGPRRPPGVAPVAAGPTPKQAPHGLPSGGCRRRGSGDLPACPGRGCWCGEVTMEPCVRGWILLPPVCGA